MAPDISIVVPVYRSEECVPALAQRVKEALSSTPYSFELILVDDCSPDSSWHAILDACRKHEFIKGLALRKNAGQDNAIMAGLHHARGEYIVIMDDDLQHDPRDIPRLVAEVERGSDVCYAKFSVKHQAWWKNLGSLLNSAAACVLVDKPRGLYMSPFKAISRGVIDEVIKYEGAYSYVDGLILRATSRTKEIAATHHPRLLGQSNYNLVRSILVWLKVMTGFSVIPLRIASFAGLAVSAAAVLLLSYFLADYILNGGPVPGWPSLMLTVLFLGGLQMMALGLIGEYVGRTYLVVSRKTQYSVKSIAPTVGSGRQPEGVGRTAG